MRTSEVDESLALVGGIGDLAAGDHDVGVAVVVHVRDLDVLGGGGLHLLGRRACRLPVGDRRRGQGRRQDDLEARSVGEQNVRAAVAVDVGEGDVGCASRGQRYVKREGDALVGRRGASGGDARGGEARVDPDRRSLAVERENQVVVVVAVDVECLQL
jgi:hypothetical protein